MNSTANSGSGNVQGITHTSIHRTDLETRQTSYDTYQTPSRSGQVEPRQHSLKPNTTLPASSQCQHSRGQRSLWHGQIPALSRGKTRHPDSHTSSTSLRRLGREGRRRSDGLVQFGFEQFAADRFGRRALGVAYHILHVHLKKAQVQV